MCYNLQPHFKFVLLKTYDDCVGGLQVEFCCKPLVPMMLTNLNFR